VLENEKQLPIVEKVMEKNVETEKMERVVNVKLWGCEVITSQPHNFTSP
jgi:hypothetical protein